MKSKVLTGFIIAMAVTLVCVFMFGIQAAKDNHAEAKEKSASGLVYVADIISVQGDGMRIKRVNSPHYLKGRVNMPDYVKDIIETDKNTMACIEFLNGSQIGVNKNTSVEIISSSQAKDITQRSTVQKIVLKSGTIWSKIRGKDSNLKIQTGKGVLGVKGTEFVVESDTENNTEKVTVLEGEVEYSPESGETQSVTPGEEIVIEPDKRIKRRKVDIKKLRDALNLRFPNLHPGAQMVIGVFSGRLLGRLAPNAARALSIARETTYLVENPEGYLKRRAASEVSRRTGVYVPGGVRQGPRT